MSSEIVVIGSLNMDMVVQVARRPERGETLLGSGFFTSPGGKGANQAYAAGRLGASVAMIGRVGDDVFADQLIRNLQQAGVDTTCIERVEDESTGVALINVDREGDNSIVVAPGANYRVTPEYVRRHAATIAAAKLVMVQLEIPQESIAEAIAIAGENSVPVMLDPAPAGQLPDELLAKVRYIVPNESEIAVLTGVEVSDEPSARQASAVLRDKGIGTVFSKLGGKGVVVTAADQSFTLPGYRVEAVDTTAAGDAFAGALATALVAGKDLREATAFANAVGALTVTRAGAQSSMPDLSETEAFMKEAGSK
ncbi:MULTISPECIES: ribokinase [Paenibacillus]|uniref:ribokinase n=1 Tax=Paenibacillus TaxID=44249 RepID=UPI002FE24C46